MSRRLFPAALLGAALFATPLFAHEPATGAHGGVRVDAGKYHAELVADGTSSVSVFLSDGADRPILAEGFKANAILLVNGKTQRFPLAPADASRLSGMAPVAVSKGVKGAVQITAPDGSTVQAKF